jgi:hypothetical protein
LVWIFRKKTFDKTKRKEEMAEKNIITKSSEYLFPDAGYAEEDGGLGLLQSGD